MKKLLVILMACFFALAFTACGDPGEESTVPEEETTVEATEATTEAEKPLELDDLQKMFFDANELKTKDDIDALIEGKDYAIYEYGYGGGYQIGFDSAAVGQRPRDRKGPSVEFDFGEDGLITKVMYEYHWDDVYGYTGSIDYEDGVYTFDGKEYDNPEEPMRVFLKVLEENKL